MNGSSTKSVATVEVRNLSKIVRSGERELRLLDKIEFSVNTSASVALLGASGSGKTTLLGLLAGLDVPTHGQVFMNGIDLTQLDEDGRADLRAGQVGFVFQNFQLLQGMTALENVMLPLELQSDPHAHKSAQALLHRVGLGERLTHYPNQLSGGEQQRCAIARAFVTNPGLLFADEPTGNLDEETGEKIIDLLFEINREQGATLILATHDSRLAQRCDHRLTLHAGQLRDA